MNDLPQDALLDGNIIYRRQWTATSSYASVKKCAVEITMRPGPSSYGLLGGIFLPGIHELSIGIQSHSVDNQRFPGSIEPSSPAYVGLPPEYVDAVAQSVDKEINLHALRHCGQLTINCGAHSVIGSSPLVFRFLSTVVTRVLLASQEGELRWDFRRLLIETFEDQVEKDKR